MTGASDPLQGAGDRGRCPHLDHLIDGAHVDAELQRTGRHHAAQVTGLQCRLDLGASLFADRAVVGAGDHGRDAADDVGGRHDLRRRPVGHLVQRAGGVFGGPQLVQPPGQPLGRPAGVGEDQRRASLGDGLVDLLFDVRPQRWAGCGVHRQGICAGPAQQWVDGWLAAGCRAGLGDVGHREADGDVPQLVRRRADHPDGSVAAEELGDSLDRTYGG